MDELVTNFCAQQSLPTLEKEVPRVVEKLTSTSLVSDLSEGEEIFNTVVADFTKFESPDVKITVRESAINGSMIPVAIEFPSKITRVWRFVEENKQKIAAMADFLVADNNGYFYTRVKMEKTGNIIAVLDDGTGHFMIAKAHVDVLIGSRAMGDEKKCTLADCYPDLASGDIRFKASEGNLKMIILNQEDAYDYVENVLLQIDDEIVAIIYFTPMVSRNPYLKIHYATTAKNVVVTINATGERSVTLAKSLGQ